MRMVALVVFLNTIFLSNHMYPENPKGARVIVGYVDMYLDTARTRNLFCPKSMPIPVGDSDDWIITSLVQGGIPSFGHMWCGQYWSWRVERNNFVVVTVLAQDAIKAALSDYRQKNQAEQKRRLSRRTRFRTTDQFRFNLIFFIFRVHDRNS